jgi:four helix bundle protein
MTPQELQDRTMHFALRVLRMVDRLPRTASAQAIGRQAARSGTSVAANYRAALRGKSQADFVNKITIVLEEADETAFWIELTARAGLLRKEKVEALRDEAEQLVRIFNATRTTARNRKS